MGREPTSEQELDAYQKYLLAYVVAAENIARNRYVHELTREDRSRNG